MQLFTKLMAIMLYVCYITISDCQTASANLDTRVSIAETVTDLVCSLTHAASIIVSYKVQVTYDLNKTSGHCLPLPVLIRSLLQRF